MGKRGLVLIFALMVVAVLAILLGFSFLRSINENNLVKRYVSSIRAFWLAEAGIAEAICHMPYDTSGSVDDNNYTYSTQTSPLTAHYYRIDSQGSVWLAGGNTINRSLNAVVRTNPVNPNNFQHAIRTTVDLEVIGNVTINGPTEESASLNFPDLFELSKDEIKSIATHLYTDPPNNVTPVSGVTWVNLSAGQELRITSNTWSGSGILVVAGDAQITGGEFDGIIYVIGKLRMSGNPVINGSVLVESDAELVEDTTITGKVNINYDTGAITSALGPLEFISPEVVSWREA